MTIIKLLLVWGKKFFSNKPWRHGSDGENGRNSQRNVRRLTKPRRRTDDLRFTLISKTTQRPMAIVLTLATAIIAILVFIIYRVTTKDCLAAA